MSRVAIVGAAGQLGTALMRAFADLGPVGFTHDTFELESPEAVARAFGERRFDVAINTAAFHNVDACEADPERAYEVNALAVDRLAAACAEAGTALAHVSTDYVFDGSASRPYVESDLPAPLNVYGISKLAGEYHVRRRGAPWFVFRTSGLYAASGSSSKGKPFIERILAQAEAGLPLRVVDDIRFSPSYAGHVASAIRRVVEREAYGLYHVSNEGACSWHEFATEILRQSGHERPVERTASSSTRSGVRRPAYSALDGNGLRVLGEAPLPPWPDGIAAYLAERTRCADASDPDAL